MKMEEAAAPPKRTKLATKLDGRVTSLRQDYVTLEKLKEELVYQSNIIHDLLRDPELMTNHTKKRDFELAATDIEHITEQLKDGLVEMDDSLASLSECADKVERVHSETLSALKQARKSFHEYAQTQIQRKRHLKKVASLSTYELRDKAMEKVNDYLNPEISLADIGD
jgi:iron-sulfur cluster repair protein YtfE (RIC family)